jgi:hypothetical protein
MATRYDFYRPESSQADFRHQAARFEAAATADTKIKQLGPTCIARQIDAQPISALEQRVQASVAGCVQVHGGYHV